MGDADDSYDFLDVPQFVQQLRAGSDVVMEQSLPRPGHQTGRHAQAPSVFSATLGLTVLLNLFFHVGIGDCYCGMRGFSRAVYDRLDVRSTGMEFAPELIIKAAQIGARISEIPIILWPDKRGRPPHLRSFRDGWRTLRFFLLYAPNWLFMLPGVSLFVFGLALVFWLCRGPRHLTSHIVLDIHTMVFGVIFTLMGAQIINMGFFAKVFSYAERFDRNPISLKRMLRRVDLRARA